MKSLFAGCCEVIFRLLPSLIYNCYPSLERLVLETKELERSGVLGLSERFINQQIPVVHTAWGRARELIKETHGLLP